MLKNNRAIKTILVSRESLSKEPRKNPRHFKVITFYEPEFFLVRAKENFGIFVQIRQHIIFGSKTILSNNSTSKQTRA